VLQDIESDDNFVRFVCDSFKERPKVLAVNIYEAKVMCELDLFRRYVHSDDAGVSGLA
jgi:hypothetical protein